MGYRNAAVCALLFAVSALGQVSVRESATRAHLVDGKTTISLALTNTASKPLEAIVLLEWFDPDDHRDDFARRAAPIPPGDSVLEIPLPLSQKFDPLLERLRYEIRPGGANYTAFSPVNGALSFPAIADYAFTLSVLTAELPRLGRPYEIRVLTFHPLTGRPMGGVKIRSEKNEAVSDQDGVALLRIPAPANPDEDSLQFGIEAALGDFRQNSETTSLPFAKDDVRIYTDKPIYQPGQTMHIRILALSGAGGVRAGIEHQVRIKNENNETVHVTTLRTSRFGIASTDWEIPANAKAGEYDIEVERDDLDAPFQRAVQVRPYELPSFRVIAKPESAFYLPHQEAVVDVRAEYLFGKPMASANVRITEDDGRQPLAEGKVDAQGRFRASFDSTVAIPAHAAYVDRHLTAFVTDASTNRTEQRKFDVRISRAPLHIYIAKTEYTRHTLRLYVTTYLPDGTPARSRIQLVDGTRVIGTGSTNRFGLARIEAPKAHYAELAVKAVAADAEAREPVSLYDEGGDIWLDTDRSLYRAGHPVICHISALARNAPVVLLAWNASGQIVYSGNALLKDGEGDAAIPYDPRFGRELSIGVASPAAGHIATRKVVFPGPGDLTVRAVSAKATYRPGDTASVQFQASAESAIGVAIVDESVFERAATDEGFQRRSWFEYSSDREPSLGGLTARDLLNIDPGKIDDELQLAASTLLPQPALVHAASDFADRQRSAFEGASAKALARVKDLLDRHYLEALDYPRDETTLAGIFGTRYILPRDPWMQPYYARISPEGPYHVIRFRSAGPDKRRDTEDDYDALQVRYKWFAGFEAAIRERLKSFVDYPASAEEFVRALDGAGIRFEALRDPWGSPMRVEIGYARDRRWVQIRSAGPDRTAGTADDFDVADFSGPYFASESAKIAGVLSAAADFPRTENDLRVLLSGAGIDFASLRDPWGRSYYAAFRTDELYTDDIRFYSYAEYDRVREMRKQITPVKRRTFVLEIRSAGEDGVRGTYDDFPVATFRHALDQETPEPGSRATKSLAPAIGGTGALAGVVMDVTGAVVPNVGVELDGVYVTHTDDNGRYTFTAIKPGMHVLRFESPGFMAHVIDHVPVQVDHVTRADAVLNVGSVAETVNVAASPAAVNFSMASIASVALATNLSTPRVREYFPETLYWQPELVTDSAGRASVRVKLADSITTWRVAVIASTVDGRIAETTADVRAFQPFMVDLDVPRVLTAGDEIDLPVPVRNYLDQAQKVLLSAAVPREITLRGEVRQPERIQPSSSSVAVLPLRAESQGNGARLRVTARASSASDAIEKPLSIHPDGERHELTVNTVAQDGRAVRFDVPAAVSGSVQAEVKFYPSLLARMLESMEALLQRPYGCGEQTISSAYPNLLFLRALNTAHLTHDRLQARAMKNLLAGYQRLLGYQDESGGFTYWGRGNPDVALTAYALRFLNDAKEFIAIDNDRVERARHWLGRQQAADASTGALRIQALARGDAADADVDRTLGDLARKAAEFDDPYAVAVFALAAMNAGKKEIARPVVQHLCGMAHDEQGAAWWSLRANTPFHGWGRWGQVETTAVALSAVAKWRQVSGADASIDALIDRAILFLLKNADSSGAWATTQATIRTLDALLDVWPGVERNKASSIDVLVNGVRAGTVAIPAANEVGGPVTLDISRFVHGGGANEITFAGAASHSTQVQVNAAWYEKWGEAESAKSLRFESRCGPGRAAVNQRITCDVLVSRPSFRGYGMVIANIGLPPGADVDRGTLASIIEDPKSGVDSFEVAPDHVTFYIWPRAADSRFQFVFRPRFAMKARSAESVLYDYYNPDERVVIAPGSFVIE